MKDTTRAASFWTLVVIVIVFIIAAIYTDHHWYYGAFAFATFLVVGNIWLVDVQNRIFDFALSKSFFETLSTIGIILGALTLLFFTCGIAAPSYSNFALFFVFGIAFFIAGNSTAIDEKEENPNWAYGSARWTNPDELLKSGALQNNGLYIGAGRQRNKIGHRITFIPSRQGKGTCLIIPSLLVKPNGSFVVTDPKGENAFITAGYQQKAGQRVIILDPWDIQKELGATHGIERSEFNPFAFIKQHPDELRDNCELIASYLVPENPDVKDPFWNNRARSMMKIFLMHIVTALPEEDHNFWTLYKMLRLADEEWLLLLHKIKNNQAEDGLISVAAGELISIEKSGNTMNSIKAAAHDATTFLESPQIRKSLSSDDFNPYDLPKGNCTVYIVVPERNLVTHSAWQRIVIGLCLKASNAKPDKRVSFILDEFGVIGKMPDIEHGYVFSAGQNIVIWTFFQDLGQAKKIYGEDGLNTFISNSPVFQAFGQLDNYSTEYISKMLGDTTSTKVKDRTTGNDAFTRTTYDTFGRRLLTPHEVSVCPEIITIVDNLRFKVVKWPYYKKIEVAKVSKREAKTPPYLDFVRRTKVHNELSQHATPPKRIVN